MVKDFRIATPLVGINLIEVFVKSYYITIDREDKGSLYSTFFCNPIAAFLEFFWIDRADSYMFTLGSTVTILDFLIAVFVDIPYIVKTSADKTREERSDHYRGRLESEKAIVTFIFRTDLQTQSKKTPQSKLILNEV